MVKYPFLPKHHVVIGSFLTYLILGGCTSTMHHVDFSSPSQKKGLELLLPSRIEIVQPFTRIRSFDGDSKPDGIELLIQAVNSLNNPGLQIMGDLRVELYEFVAASGEHKGSRLENWDIQLNSVRDQETFWNSLTRMYEFRLGINPAKIPQADHYVLTITYNSPFGERLTDEQVIRFQKSQVRSTAARSNP